MPAGSSSRRNPRQNLRPRKPPLPPRRHPRSKESTPFATPAPWVYSLPAINATLNGTSAVFLLIGYIMIRSHKILAHKTCMLIAFFCSAIFLVGYLYYHFT